MNDSVITLNHVVHHGAIGHHVQNHHAYAGASRVGRVAAVDTANRIAMFSGGSLAEGWACYVCDLMEEIGFLTPLEQIAQQHTRVRIAARAVADLSIHSGAMTQTDAARLYVERAYMSEAAAHGEAVRNTMFPGTAVMYWLGTTGTASPSRVDASAARGKFFPPRVSRSRALIRSDSSDADFEADARRGDPRRDTQDDLEPGARSRRHRVVEWVLAAGRVGRRPEASAADRPRDPATRLVIGYDREPDTLNRFSTHILEDIETCVVEGLVTTDQSMTIVPLLAASVPTIENGGVVLRQDGGMDVTWRLRPEREVARRHASHLGGREVHGRGDQQPGL